MGAKASATRCSGHRPLFPVSNHFSVIHPLWCPPTHHAHHTHHESCHVPCLSLRCTCCILGSSQTEAARRALLEFSRVHFAHVVTCALRSAGAMLRASLAAALLSAVEMPCCAVLGASARRTAPQRARPPRLPASAPHATRAAPIPPPPTPSVPLLEGGSRRGWSQCATRHGARAQLPHAIQAAHAVSRITRPWRLMPLQTPPPLLPSTSCSCRVGVRCANARVWGRP